MNSLFRFSDLSKPVEKVTLSVASDITTEAYSSKDLNDIALQFQSNDLVSFLTKGRFSLYTLHRELSQIQAQVSYHSAHGDYQNHRSEHCLRSKKKGLSQSFRQLLTIV